MRRHPSPLRSARKQRSGASLAHWTSHSPVARANVAIGSGDRRTVVPSTRRSTSTRGGARRTFFRATVIVVPDYTLALNPAPWATGSDLTPSGHSTREVHRVVRASRSFVDGDLR